MADIPTTEPSEIQAGDTIKWRREDLSDYPASVWSLKYYFVGKNGLFNVTAAADGDKFAVTISAATSAAYVAGDYEWSAYVSKGSGAGLERYQVDSGKLKVKPNVAGYTAAYDNRSHAKKVLDAIEAVIEGRATKDQESYSIAGRQLSRTPIADLLKLRDRYKAEYRRELDAEKINNGLGTGRKILTRFMS